MTRKNQKLIAGTPAPIYYSLLGIVIISVILIFPILTYPFHVIRCGGLPVTASNFAAGYDYFLPGDRGYLGLFNNKFFCSEVEAKSGYHRTVNHSR